MSQFPDSEFKGYPVINSERPNVLIQGLTNRYADIEMVPTEDHVLGTAIHVEGILDGRNPKVLGRLKDKKGDVEGSFVIEVFDSSPHPKILVPADKITIG